VAACGGSNIERCNMRLSLPIHEVARELNVRNYFSDMDKLQVSYGTDN